ncbi:hypothetical protein AnigIFM63326_006589 [Aspergillus niger]|nr:hypothetical protein AnigIFM63326_006589 [Aspergillus niger]
MPTLFPEVPTSIRSDLITEVPTSVISEMTNPTAWSSVASEWRDGIVPSWYSSLNGDVKSYFSTAFETASPSTSSSHGGAGPGAPKPTGMAGIMGAAGILGMAIVLYKHDLTLRCPNHCICMLGEIQSDWKGYEPGFLLQI